MLLNTQGLILSPIFFSFKVCYQHKSTPHASKPHPTHNCTNELRKLAAHCIIDRALSPNCQSDIFFLTPIFPTHTHFTHTVRTPFHSLQHRLRFTPSCAALRRRLAKQKPHKISFPTGENKQERGRAGNHEPTYGSHHDRNSLAKRGLCTNFFQGRKKEELPPIEPIALHSFCSSEEHSSQASSSTAGRLGKSHSPHQNTNHSALCITAPQQRSFPCPH